jgi:hypothetical protein
MSECCFEGCSTPALCRVPTISGWANVCEYHYPKVDKHVRIGNSPLVDEVLKAYKNSQAWKEKHP